MNPRPKELSFWEHLEELRGRLVKSILAIVIGAFIFYLFVDRILAILILPVGKVIFTSPVDAFLARLYLTLWGGFLLALPVVLYQIWQFAALALTPKEHRYILFWAPLSFLLFIFGALFAYFVMIPISLKFLLGFAGDSIVPMIEIKNYISFVGTMVLAFGVVFELPLVLLFLTKIGIATPAFLIQKRRHAIVIILIISAILTPPDVFTQIIMAAPLLVLYEIGICVCRWTCRASNPS